MILKVLHYHDLRKSRLEDGLCVVFKVYASCIRVLAHSSVNFEEKCLRRMVLVSRRNVSIGKKFYCCVFLRFYDHVLRARVELCLARNYESDRALRCITRRLTPSQGSEEKLQCPIIDSGSSRLRR